MSNIIWPIYETHIILVISFETGPFDLFEKKHAIIFKLAV